jgi:hypothetical protein
MQTIFFEIMVQKKKYPGFALLINCYVIRLYLNYAC